MGLRYLSDMATGRRDNLIKDDACLSLVPIGLHVVDDYEVDNMFEQKETGPTRLAIFITSIFVLICVLFASIILLVLI